MTSTSSGDSIKRPNVSGQFYPSRPQQLSAQIDDFLRQAEVSPGDAKVEILISPHAGYIYSGPVAAHGFKAVVDKPYKTVVVIAPSHHFRLDGFAVWGQGGFETPLGIIPVDEDFAKDLIAQNDKFMVQPSIFEGEHSLEVQLPFLQKTLKDFQIVPVIAGQPTFNLVQDFAKSLNKLMGNRQDILIVISTDMSHFYDAETAQNMDRRTIQAVQDLRVEEVWQKCQGRGGEMELCGVVPVTVALLLAQDRGLDVEILKYAHSGQTAGDNSRVVGYFSAIFYPAKNSHPHDSSAAEAQKLNAVAGVEPLSREQKKILIQIARKTVSDYVQNGTFYKPQVTDKRLHEIEGAFVTIRKKGQLRGCIGNIIGRQPLYQTVRDMAIAASSKDPRFDPVNPAELPELEIEISVLSKPQQIQDPEMIKMGVHGVIVSQGPFHQGVFLPQVATETGWNREQFLAALCAHKAGLPADAWKDPRTKIEIFTAEVFSAADVE